ncbi:uncharacterized protein F4822DRAFT_395621 [Hypoxylon trugodes]|uniref:uncharacterized protein n=1 Tax=Hypoxylon trugodes TaxID=326681 RepID=UPI00218EBB9E|nr:uncharacterized protein F4822DRAFT_395621 [Hypoxylon trugodes]KAI1391122.1 hypothetical protein F4822DRAFT_395621 [Hypoxylon trugodes]
MDWLTRLQVFGTSYLYPTLNFILRLCYIITIPLHYPIYYLFLLVVFLLSPFWYILRSISTAALAAVNLAIKLKYLYIYLAYAAIIGICAGFLLHGTSSFIFVSLGVDASQKRARDQQRSELSPLDDEEHYLDEPESGTRSEDSSGRLSGARDGSKRTKTKREPKEDAYGMFEKKWKSLSSSERPRRRRRGLLAQTIHEESSSDFS